MDHKRAEQIRPYGGVHYAILKLISLNELGANQSQEMNTSGCISKAHDGIVAPSLTNPLLWNTVKTVASNRKCNEPNEQ
jgi:hypothetical protein